MFSLLSAYCSTAGCGGGGGGGSQQTLSVSISPPTVSLIPGASQQFSANASNGTAATLTVQEAGGGTVTPSGLYTAPNVTGTYHIIATSIVDPTKTATATITVAVIRDTGSGRVTPVGAPFATQSYSVSITPPGGVPIVVTVDKRAGLPLDPASFSELPVGTLTAVTTAYSELGGRGVALAAGSTTLNVVRGSSTDVQVRLASTIDHVELTPINPTINVGASQQMVVVAKNGSNVTIPLTPSKILWSTFDNYIAVIDSNGNVTGINPGSTQVMVSDSESLKTTYTGITVSALPPPPRKDGKLQLENPTFATVQQSVAWAARLSNSKLITYGDRGKMRRWSADGKTLEEEATIGSADSPPAFTYDGKTLVVADPGTGRLIFIDPMNLFGTSTQVTGLGQVHNSCALPDGTMLAASTTNGLYKVNVRTLVKTLLKNTPCASVAYDGTSYWLLEGNGDLVAYNLSTGQFARRITPGAYVSSLYASKGYNVLIGKVNGGPSKQWRTTDGTSLPDLAAQNGNESLSDFGPDFQDQAVERVIAGGYINSIISSFVFTSP